MPYMQESSSLRTEASRAGRRWRQILSSMKGASESRPEVNPALLENAMVLLWEAYASMVWFCFLLQGHKTKQIIHRLCPTLELAVGDMSKTVLTTMFGGQAGQN